MAYEEDRAPALCHLRHLLDALALELQVADSENLVHQEDLGVQVSGNREGEPYLHPARIAFDHRVDELSGLGKLDDLLELRIDLALSHAEDAAVEIDVLPSRQLRMETGADFEQAADAAMDIRVALGGSGDPREHLEQGRLPRSVATDYPDDVSLVDGERNVVEGPERFLLLLGLGGPATKPPSGCGEGLRDDVAECHVAFATADPVSLREAVRFDRSAHQMTSAIKTSRLRK